jgi:DUF4097 and DUF4098 domain-containing protein YvlB
MRHPAPVARRLVPIRLAAARSFLLTAGLTAVSAAALEAAGAGTPPVPDAASLSREVHKTVPLSPTGRLEISTFKGSIAVSVWDRPEAEISARIEPDGDDSDMRRKVERTEVRIETKGDTVRVVSDYDHTLHLFSFFDTATLPFVRYTIRMPATARLEIEDHKSETTVAGLRSDLRIRTYKGTVRVDGLDGAADVHTHKGEIHVAFARFSKASRFETYKGSIDVRLPKDSKFELDANGGRRGEVESDFAVTSLHRGRHGGESVRGPVNGGGPELSFESHKGSFRLRGD